MWELCEKGKLWWMGLYDDDVFNVVLLLLFVYRLVCLFLF